MAEANRDAPSGYAALRPWLKSFLDSFAEMPHRGSGTHYEARAARLLSRLAGDAIKGRVELEPFAVDISSGSWNVALHGTILCAFLALLWLGGLGATFAWGAGEGAARLGPLGTVPGFVVFACLGVTVLLLISRRMAGRGGWGIFSFFVPNADSANVIVTTLAEAEDGECLRLPEAERWKRRFQASGAKRLLVLSAHYDSARCLPPSSGKGAPPAFLLAALKNGIGLIPTLAYLFLCLAFAAAGILGLADPSGAVMSGPVGWLLALLAALSFVVAAVEAIVAGESVDKPFEQGYNDNLSGVAAVLGAFRELSPRVAPGAGGSPAGEPTAAGLLGDTEAETARTGLDETAVIVVLTGSEENGLRGSTEFACNVLKPAVAHFGFGRVLLVNVDSVSGGELLASPGERNFMGAIRRGDPAFAKAAVDFLRGRLLDPEEAAAEFTDGEWASCLVAESGGYGYAIMLQGEPLPACTDITGFCSVPEFNHRLRAFTLVSRDRKSGPLPQPRDYHQPSDNHETMFLKSEPANFGTVLCVARALAELARETEKGSFDGA